jgi:hypothetical protein
MGNYSSYVSISISKLVPQLSLGNNGGNAGYWSSPLPQTIAPGTAVGFDLIASYGPSGTAGFVNYGAAGSAGLYVAFACPYWSSNSGRVTLNGTGLAVDWYAKSDSNGWQYQSVQGSGHPLHIAVFVRASSEPKHPPPS